MKKQIENVDACYFDPHPMPIVYTVSDGYTKETLVIGIIQKRNQKGARRHNIELDLKQAMKLVIELKRRIREAKPKARKRKRAK